MRQEELTAENITRMAIECMSSDEIIVTRRYEYWVNQDTKQLFDIFPDNPHPVTCNYWFRLDAINLRIYVFHTDQFNLRTMNWLRLSSEQVSGIRQMYLHGNLSK